MTRKRVNQTRTGECETTTVSSGRIGHGSELEEPPGNQDKPFTNVNGIDLEVLDSMYSDAILISNQVTCISCDKASVSVDLSGTPFFFPSDTNYFGSVGFGNLATILSNEGNSLGGCIQLSSDDGASEYGCITLITANFTSYSVNMRAMYPDSKR
ncbi:hypothetical protein Goari_024995 [Gossypium aridum]|uniref:Uncharacterized protein n=1 Tax=Gossypium aridum TaxID=34290 RepID=A0A7J8X7S2_GOSAI|nr:hypothetical protein [Gossypium aridum]